MNDPKRLIEADDVGADLLASARADAPSRHARGRAAAALGIGVGIAAVTAGGTASAGATAGASAGAGAGAGAGAMATKAAGAGLLTKILGGTLVVAAIGGGTVVAVRESSRPAPITVATAAPTTAAPTATEAPSATSVATAEPTVEVTALPATKSPPRPSATVVSPPATHDRANHDKPVESALTREVRSLDAARTLLDRRDAAGALAALDRHDREFANGSLRAESAMLRVEALLAKGDEAGAKARAKELLARDPNGPHAKRLRSIVDR